MVRNWLIKKLGGYTEKEYIRVERKYQGLLDSKSNDATVKVCNENIYKTLLILDRYAKNELYGLVPDIWAKRMYNVIHNNLLRVMIRYVHTGASVIYSFDTTIDNPREFNNILKQENIDIDDSFILESDNE